MAGRKLLLLRPQLVDEKDPTRFRPGSNTIVAVDSVGAGEGELVMFCQGSSARLAPNLKQAPVDAVIIGIYIRVIRVTVTICVDWIFRIVTRFVFI